jgi:hypothetical protein
MTAQFRPKVIYRGKAYDIAVLSDDGCLFSPSDHGLRPVAKCSACWDGYLCAFCIDEHQLMLNTLYLCSSETPHKLFNIQAKPFDGPIPVFDYVFEALRHRIEYSGGMLLYSGFTEEYVPTEFDPPLKYQELCEFAFQNGELQGEADRTEQVAALRAEIARRQLLPGDTWTRDKIKTQIAHSFFKDYNW